MIGIFVPESPTWLLQRDLFQLAESVIVFLGRNEEEFNKEVSNNLKIFLFVTDFLLAIHNTQSES